MRYTQKHLCVLLCALILSACAGKQPPPTQSPSGLPTSERLVNIKSARLATIQAEMESKNFTLGAPVFIRVFKRENILETWVFDEELQQFRQFKSYPICNFSGALGPKLREGDRQAPEGFYMIGADQMNPWSRHQLSFNLGFPNNYDQAWGRTGSALMIHGGCTSIGCYAMTDPMVEEIYLMVEASIESGHNVPVHAFPFRMNPRTMFAYSAHPWSPFWQNLKTGYDAFETTRIPPQVHAEFVEGAPKYVFTYPQDTENSNLF